MTDRLGSALALGVRAALLFGLLSGGSAYTQEMGPKGVFPSLPEDHWAVEAAWRAEALGLATAYLPAQRAVPRDAVARALREAMARAPVEAPAVAGLARAWYRRFQEEFPESRGPAPGGSRPALLGSSVGAGYLDRSGGLAPETGLASGRTGATPVPAASGALLSASVAVGVAPFLSVLAQPEYRAGEMRWRGWDVIAGAGPVSLSAGRQPVGYGWAEGGGVVLSAATLDRIQFQTDRPVVFPGVFQYVGPVSLHVFLSRFSETRHPGDPYFLGMSGAFRPHPRLTLTVHRASMFGGDSTDVPLTPRTVGRMLLGIYEGTSGFENQVVSASGRLRLPTEAFLPLTLYAEWGADDAAGAWWDVPARTVGIRAAALPGFPQAEAGVEHSSFAGSCCGNPPWYRHAFFDGHWVTGDRPLGHGIGGHGSQWLLYGGADLLDARLRIDSRVFRRERGEENLYAPERTGHSTGVTVGAAWRVLPFGEIGAYYVSDAGDGWDEQEFRATASILF